jgi:hypothetical protein
MNSPQPRGRAGHAVLVEQRIKHGQQVEVDLLDIGHRNIRTIILRLEQCHACSYVIPNAFHSVRDYQCTSPRLRPFEVERLLAGAADHIATKQSAAA